MRKIIYLFFTILALPVLSCTNKENNDMSFVQMEKQFRQVPEKTPIAVYWYWMSDHISEEGVLKDLEAMKKAGINRAFIGNIGQENVEYGKHPLFSDEWWKITHAALKKASELDIEIGIFNSPGWTASGGPWVKPEQSMRYLASAELAVEGPQILNSVLPEVGEHAQDVRVIAYPLHLGGESATINVEKMDDKELNVNLKLPGQQPMRTLLMKVDRPAVLSATLYYRRGETYEVLKKVRIDRSNTQLKVGFIPLAPVVAALPETTATDFQLRISGQDKAKINVELTSIPMVERYPEKTFAKMFPNPLPPWDAYMWENQPECSDPAWGIDPAEVVDLTAGFKEGNLKWDVPAGKWKIVRTAMLPTGTTNLPASTEGRGPETDKLSKTHLAPHFDAFIGEILRRIPAQDRRTFKVVVQDSYEVGGQNWTDDMAARFKDIYQYDPVPYLPVLSGHVVGSRDQSDRFLWDLRRLVADRVAHDYVGGMRELSHRHGLTTWLENYGHRGFPAEFLQYGGQADEVAGEFWSEGASGSMENRAASSCAHIYGKRNVWAESFTAAWNGFSRYPYVMKQRGDKFFTEGINSTLLHLYIQQPYEELNPGMAANFGNEFNRKNIWFTQMDVFTAYLKRVNFMLKQGEYVADAAYFIGEDVPKMTGICDPVLPKEYSFDYINAEVLMRYASVKNGNLTLAGGMQYKVLVLPKIETMRPELLAVIEKMVGKGLTIVGPCPKRSPSLENYPEADRQVQRLAGKLWQGVEAGGFTRYGKGYVFGEGNTMKQVFAEIDIQPDCKIDQDSILFIHRTAREGDIYFISNQKECRVAFDATFRVGKGKPELWDALTGEIRPLPQYEQDGTSTRLHLELMPLGSACVVFRQDAGKVTHKGENFPQGKTVAMLNENWKVWFEGIGAPEDTVAFETLYDWKESTDERIKFFSGTAHYENTFDIKQLPSGQLYVDLGKVMVMGKAYVNGKYAGGVWTYPYRLNVTELLKQGTNIIRIDIVNNWRNRLIGDLKLPVEERRTWTSINHWNADSPLQSSGLLGPVTVQQFDYVMP